jgi:hypothetical protein
MTIVRVGTNQKYANGWESVFGKGGKKKPASDHTAKTAVGATKAAPPKPIKPAKSKVVKKKAPSKKAKVK